MSQQTQQMTGGRRAHASRRLFVAHDLQHPFPKRRGLVAGRELAR